MCMVSQLLALLEIPACCVSWQPCLLASGCLHPHTTLACASLTGRCGTHALALWPVQGLRANRKRRGKNPIKAEAFFPFGFWRRGEQGGGRGEVALWLRFSESAGGA